MTLTQNSDRSVVVCYPIGDNSVESWVQQFIQLLSHRLDRKTGESSTSVQRLPIDVGASSLEPDSVALLDGAEAIIFVLTEAFVSSNWISADSIDREGEFGILLNPVRERGDSDAGVFLVELSRLTRDLPDELQRQRAHRFWKFDPDTDETTLLPAIIENGVFVNSLINLAIEVRDVLEPRQAVPAKEGSHQERAGEHADGGEAEKKPRVVLASVTDDLNDIRRGVRDYLIQQGCDVPREIYFGEASEIRDKLNEALNGAVLFVQLLGQHAGKVVPGTEVDGEESGETFSGWQNGIARASGVPILQWRGAQLDSARIAEVVSSEDHKKLLLGSEVQSRDIEDFKPEIMRVLRRDHQETPTVKGNAEWIFVHSQSDERQATQELLEHLETCQFFVTTPMRMGSAREIFDDLESNVKQCDGMIVIYDDHNSTWVRRQLMHIRKMLFKRPQQTLPTSPDRTFPVRALYLGPPRVKREQVRIRFPGMESIDCTDGLNINRISPFLDRLTELTVQRPDTGVVEVEEARFEVFLAHNSHDKDYVRKVRSALADQGVQAWIDEEQIRAGDAPVRAISEALASISVVAVFIGPRGEGQWQDNEIDAALAAAAEGRQRVIPVLLPGIDAVPKHQTLLRAKRWISFEGDEPEAHLLEELIRGIRT